MINSTEPSLISYKTLRRTLGILGILLPIILYIGNWLIFGDSDLKSSMSKYYHTGMGDVLVGTIFAYGIFLFTYRGYEKIDKILGFFAGLFALGVALFPTNAENTTRGTAGWVHIISTLLFYAMLVVFSIYLFRKTHPLQDPPQEPLLKPTPKKLLRNKVYLFAGILMIICIILIGIIGILDLDILGDTGTFWLEAIANTSFGISWLVKGNGVPKLNDR